MSRASHELRKISAPPIVSPSPERHEETARDRADLLQPLLGSHRSSLLPHSGVVANLADTKFADDQAVSETPLNRCRQSRR
jgi:hypothetical protein